jgi:putative hydrolase of the HAD superfamily
MGKGTRTMKVDLTRFQAVVFDLFHTLTSIESTEAGGPGTNEVLRVSRKAWNEQLLHHSDDRLRGRLVDAYEIMRTLADQIDASISEETVREAARVRMDRFTRSLMRIDRAVLETLGELRARGMRLGLVSNADSMEIAGWKESPLAVHFESAVFSCQRGHVKPERRSYEICLEELEVLPEQTLFVGDGGSNELWGAKNVGLTTVLTTHVVRRIWPEELPFRRKYADYEIDRIDGLLEE